MTTHEKVLYALVAAMTVCLAYAIENTHGIAVSALATAKLASTKADTAPTAARKPPKGSWASLGEAKTIELGERLAATMPRSVTIFCAGPECRDVQADIDNSLTIAGWDGQFSSSVLVDGSEDGLLVGPPGAAADALQVALSAVAPTRVVDMRVDTDLGIIIGRPPR